MPQPINKHKKNSSKQLKGIYLLPNLFTVGGLFFGFYAIIMALRQDFTMASIMIFLAMLLDGLDGRIARMINAQSDFGAELDSLADMASFGVAPALLLYAWVLYPLGKTGWLVAFIYMACTALRLARFNVRNAYSTNKAFFQGLSTTAAAGCIASLVWLCHHHAWSGKLLSYAVVILTLCIAFLKVSTIAFRSFKDINYQGRVPFTAVLCVVLVFALITFDPPDILALLFWGYAISGPISSVHRFFKRRRARRRKAKP